MTTGVVFVHGAGAGAHREDQRLVDDLAQELGPGFTITYPAMPDEEDPRFGPWGDLLAEVMPEPGGDLVLVGHSFGASVLLKTVAAAEVPDQIVGLFLLATPFWGGDGWRYEGFETLEVSPELASHLPEGLPIFLYHCRDDEIVPFEHLDMFSRVLPQATPRRFGDGGHQLVDRIPVVARDMRLVTDG